MSFATIAPPSRKARVKAGDADNVHCRISNGTTTIVLGEDIVTSFGLSAGDTITVAEGRGKDAGRVRLSPGEDGFKARTHGAGLAVHVSDLNTNVESFRLAAIEASVSGDAVTVTLPTAPPAEDSAPAEDAA